MSALSALYGRVASARRAWYARRPHAVRRLPCPVVSVGNLVVGGSGKTPLVMHLARLLQEAGEHPAVLSRGYARRERREGVVVVSDGRHVLATVEQAGDEPFLLAQALPGVPVLVCDDRYLAGQLAWRRFGTTVAVLDDGFQHVQLARDVDLLLVSPADLRDDVLPTGSLREPLAAARAADAVLAPPVADDVRAGAVLPTSTADAIAARLGVPRAFEVHVTARPPRLAWPGPARAGVAALDEPHPPAGSRVAAVCAIARPARFIETVERQGWQVAASVTFPDHHWFTAADVRRVDDAVRHAGVQHVLTTEKDAVRLSCAGAAPSAPWWALPIEATVQPADAFAEWLTARVASARATATAAGQAG